MTKDEILKKLVSKAIIAVIADSYFITDKYKNCFEDMKSVPKEVKFNPEYQESKNEQGPFSIINSKGKARYTAFMDECEIASVSPNGKYLLRNYTKEAEKVLNSLLDSNKVDLIILINSVKQYYNTIELPKSFKNYCSEWLILDVYNSVKSIGTLGTQDHKTNETWG